MKTFTHRFVVNAPIASVAGFHRAAESMAAITPPPVLVKLHDVPEHLHSGDQMAFTMWLGPLPLRWVARIEDVTDTGFVDELLEGPFASWTHRHEFIARGSGRTEVRDLVQATLRREPFWRLIGTFMWLNLRFLFAYRGWKTRRILEQYEIPEPPDQHA